VAAWTAFSEGTADDGLGLDQCQRLSPIGPVSQQENPEGSVSIREAGLFGVSLEDFKLMTKRKVFQGQCAVGPQDRDEGAKKDEYHGRDDIIESS
jgi:hypothetical protein